MRDALRQYFGGLFLWSADLIMAVPLTRAPPLMDHIVAVLRPIALSAEGNRMLAEPDAAIAGWRAQPASDSPVGLNTVGLLLDRLSILAIKHWNLIHRAGDASRAADLQRGPVQEIVEALAAAQPGHASYNSKITVHGARPAAASFVAAYRGLLVTNLLLWEAQEVLYNHDLAQLPDSELRAYVSFFSENNLTRNGFMEDADRLFWAARRAAASA
jgi:hypothetical protein